MGFGQTDRPNKAIPQIISKNRPVRALYTGILLATELTAIPARSSADWRRSAFSPTQRAQVDHLPESRSLPKMTRHTKIAFLYLLALVPLCLAAVAWPIVSFGLERANYQAVIMGAVAVGVSTLLRIQLPKSNRNLDLSNTIILLSLLYFGGEYAVLMSLVAAVISCARRIGTSTVLRELTNFCISVITVFVTAIGILTFFGSPETVLLKLSSLTFALVVSALALSTFVLDTILTSAQLAITGEKHYWEELKLSGTDSLLVHAGSALMAGVGLIALKDTNLFLFFTIVGFFCILQIAFRRYRSDHEQSRVQAAKAEREHVAELKHYIDELELSQERYRHAAYHDPLTGLPNRNRFIEVIDRLLQSCQGARRRKFAVLYLDMHRFKTVNDSLGHAIGDKLINNVANRLSTMVKFYQMIGRFSGDEFAILLPVIKDVDEAIQFAAAVVKELSEPYELDKREIFTSASIGLAVGSSKYKTAGDVLRDADIAMYRAKERKRPVVVFEDRMHVQAMSLLQLETDLRRAVERNEFELFYQPIIELDTMRLAGVEALVRWCHPELGYVYPEKFIDVMEATGLIIPMTLQILEQACRQLNDWKRNLGSISPSFVSVNLSGKHFNHPDVVEHIAQTLCKTAVDPGAIKLEITETAVMDNAERAATVLRQIKDLGVKLCIDDFGTGYSSLSYLQRFPIDTLKIDRSFVRSMEDGRQNGEIVRTILALAEAMKLSVVAEGIESVHQLHQLRILNCSYGQGYLFSHPLAVKDIEGLMRTANRWEDLVAGNSFAIIPPIPELLELRVN